MDLSQIKKIITQNNSHTFQAINFGCRVNSAEINQLSQILVNLGLKPNHQNPDIILINTCAVTKKGEYESLSKVTFLNSKFPKSLVFITGCANLSKVENLQNVYVFNNSDKEKILEEQNCAYTSQIDDKFSHTHRFLLKTQSGCTADCTYCIVPLKRPQLWSLPIDLAVKTVTQAVNNGYQEVIITGVNLNQYRYGFSALVEALLTQTRISKISFGSIPLLCIDDKFLDLLEKYPNRISHFLHIPLQSGSDKILADMNRHYNREKIIKTFNKLKKIATLPPTPCNDVIASKAKQSLQFGTDIIVGFPGETETDFQNTLNVCQQIGFSKIHTFRFSPRAGTRGLQLFNTSTKISQSIKKTRSQEIRRLIK